MSILNERKYIVTVINSVTETSMPYNEFVLYRFNVSPQDKQLVLVCSKSRPEGIAVPNGLDLYFVGNSLNKIKKIMKQVEKECKSNGMKLIIHLHQPKSATLFNLSTLVKNYRKRAVFTVHSLFDAYDSKNKFLSVLSALLARKVTCVSKASYNHYPALIKKIKGNDMIPLRNGVDLKRIENVIHSDEVHTTSVKTLIYVARMIPIKNHEFLIKVFSKLNGCRLVLIGAEDKNGEIRKIVEAEKLSDRVEFAGLIPRDEVFRKLKQADIYVSPSTVEGLPVSVLEAMYVGLPVVISDIEPHQEIGIYNKNVTTLPIDETKWIESLNNYINMDRKSLKQMGNACKECAEKHFSLDSMLKQFDELYEML